MSRFTDDQLATYQRDGFFIARGLFARDEIDKLRRFAEEDPSFAGGVYGRKDATGHETKLALWNHAGEDLYSMFARSPRIVNRMEQALGGEVYLYHMKMMLKEPRVGGAWEWHQDYGYWYHNGCLLPLLASCLIAVTRANRANGCLQMIRGSHLMGRIDHGKTGDQTGAAWLTRRTWLVGQDERAPVWREFELRRRGNSIGDMWTGQTDDARHVVAEAVRASRTGAESIL